ncbi:outer membrane protein transport protein, partial [Salmonella enterica subsp. enterica serovar Anatum]|nr:outer membrane protein transport protein [Salmonella enterica subsp. enterica serovar Anatum]
NEFSSSGLGRAYSGEGAIADDAGNVSRNPALITMFDRPTFSADVKLLTRSTYRHVFTQQGAVSQLIAGFSQPGIEKIFHVLPAIQ